MKASARWAAVPVKAPFRLDLTAQALRRTASNAVDVYEDGILERALRVDGRVAVLQARQPAADMVEVRCTGMESSTAKVLVTRMLGTDVDLSQWYGRVRAVPWLHELSDRLAGVKPPRYPSLWEALCHSIVFQQISIHAAAAIMRRMIERYSEPLTIAGRELRPFPEPRTLLTAAPDDLRSVSLSVNKVVAIQSVAAAMLAREITEERIAALPSPQALELLSTLRGIGPWSAAVVLLRGFGRLDVFPMKDSGVAASLRLLSGNQNVSAEAVLAELGPVRGMLYFHLLLGRLAHSATRGGLKGVEV